jgi:hypothetical protein
MWSFQKDPHPWKWNTQDIKVMNQWYKRAGDMAMSKNKEGLLLCYCEICSRVVPTYREDDGVSAAAPHQAVATDSRSNPNSTAGTQKNFAAAVLQDEPAALDPNRALGTETEITPTLGTEAKTEDRTTAVATILALDPAA